MVRETYAGPMPPDVSQDAVDCAVRELREMACHYGWTDEQLETDLVEIAEYVSAVCVTDVGEVLDDE